MQNKITRFLFYFLIFLIALQFFVRKDGNTVDQGADVIITSKNKFVVGKEVIVEIENRSQQTLKVASNCPQNPLIVDFYRNGEWMNRTSELKNPALCDQLDPDWGTIEPGSTAKIAFGQWNQGLFNETGLYRISLETIIDESPRTYFHEIKVNPPSLIRRGWNTLLYKPIFNTLIYFISTIPSHNLGWAIILLTLVIKLILLAPNHKALKAQKQLQTIQPHLDALKLKYKDNPQRLAKETMEIWKKHKVNPMGSCLPMLIQFPILIALFYVVRDGLGVIDPNLLYAPLKNFDGSTIQPVFLGIFDLTKVNFITLPLTVGLLQYVQIKLSLGRSKALSTGGSNPALSMMNQMMQYFLPVMIAVFTATLPAAVGFYWGTSTIFAIGQQWVVNRSKD